MKPGSATYRDSPRIPVREGLARVDARAGFTLIEVMVAASIMIMLLGLIFWFLVPAMRYSAEGTMKVDMQQEAVLAMGRIVADLQRTTAQGISFSPTTGSPAGTIYALGVVPMESIGPDGKPVWADGSSVSNGRVEGMDVYYLDNTDHHLYEKYYPPKPPSVSPAISFATDSPAAVTSDQLSQIASASQPNGTERSLADHVTEFWIRHAKSGATAWPWQSESPSITEPIIITITMDQDVPHTQQKAHVELTRRVYLRNAL